MKFYHKTKTTLCMHIWIKTRSQTTTNQRQKNFPQDNITDNSIQRPITLVSKSLSSTERRHSNLEKEVLGILHGLQKFHHYYFAREV